MSWSLNLEELVRAVGGRLIQSGDTKFSGISTDTRKIKKGSVFFALKGENFDGHDFLDKALVGGASVLIVQRPVQVQSGVSVIEVSDTLKALQDLALFWRRTHRAKVIGITGSNGKTTTKDFANVLIRSKFKTVATQGNLNNFIGLPISLLTIDSTTDVGIFEMGLSIPGEIELLTKIAEPDIVVVTSVGRAHLEGLGGIEGVAQNKGQIYTHSKPGAVHIVNLDNPYTNKMKDQFPPGTKVMTFSSENPEATVVFREQTATLEALEIKGSIQGEPGSARIPVFGRHNISNLMAASCLALAAGIEPDLIWKTLPQCKGYWGRNQIVPLKSGASALFDAYNANPDSVEALLKNVSRISLKGRLFGVFGDMLELGSESPILHEAWGQLAGKLGFESILFVGPHFADFARGVKASGFRKKLVVSGAYEDELAHELRTVLNPGDIVLVKGSRGMKLERVLKQLEPLDFHDYK